MLACPEGWAQAALGDVLAPSKERVHPFEVPGVRYLSLEHIEPDTGKILGHGVAEDVKSTKSVFRTGDVLYGKLRPYLNKVCLAEYDGICSTDILVFPKVSYLDSRFLKQLLAQRSVVQYAHHNSTGVQLPRIGFSALSKFPILVPPLEEQKRIAASVEALLTRVAAAREGLDRVPGIINRFHQSVLTDACSGALTADWRFENMQEIAEVGLSGVRERAGSVKVRRGVPGQVPVPDDLASLALPQTWTLESVAALLRGAALLDVKDGNHGAQHPTKGEFTDDGLPFITAAQVRDFDIDYDGAPKVAGEPLTRLRVGFAEPNDVVLTHKGTIGRAALNTQSCVLSPQTTYYRCNREVIEPQYLAYFSGSLWFYRQLAAVMSQTTRDYVPISEQYALFLFVPPIEEQKEIVRRVAALLSLAVAAEARYKRAMDTAGRLPQSVLSQAFAGQLVPTEAELARADGREFETAEALLARVATASSAAGQTVGPT